MAMTLEATQGVNDCVRWYKSDAGSFVVEIATCEYDHSKNSLMSLWVKHGWVDDFIEKVLWASTYYTDDEGNCWGRYNPQYATEVDEYGEHRAVIDFGWMLEATPENERRLLEECERLMVEAKANEQA